MNKVLNKSYKECVKTIDNICVTNILKIIDYIKTAEKIFIYARGFTALVADELCMQLQLLGYNALVVKDVTWMVKTDKLVNSNEYDTGACYKCAYGKANRGKGGYLLLQRGHTAGALF